jgi:uncharacterized damage-inducible protein DinB
MTLHLEPEPTMSAESPAAPSVQQVALADLDGELKRARTLLERVPDDNLDWKPHPKSMPLGSLALHIATLPYWIETIAGTDYLDLASGLPRNEPPRSRQDVLDAFDARVAAMRAALERADDATLLGPWELRMAGNVMMRMPRVAMIREMGISHFIHHRAQLGVYLRLLDVPLPPMYGPSADERPNFG